MTKTLLCIQLPLYPLLLFLPLSPLPVPTIGLPLRFLNRFRVPIPRGSAVTTIITSDLPLSNILLSLFTGNFSIAAVPFYTVKRVVSHAVSFVIFFLLRFRRSVDHDPVRSLRSASNLSRPSFDPATPNAKFDLRVNIPPARVLAGEFSTLVAAPQALEKEKC